MSSPLVMPQSSRTNQLVEDVMPIDQALADTNGGLDDQHGDEWDPNVEAILDSESDSEDRRP